MKFDKLTFEKYRKEFSLGHLTTEGYHPFTAELSRDAINDLPKAIQTLKAVDEVALETLRNYKQKIYSIVEYVQKNKNSIGKIFIVGCGATGRLALSLEKIAIETGIETPVISFMAGGDYALIKSVESFEDSFDYGKKQLLELGFSKDDLLIAVTEGGETSFVIGACEEASRVSKFKPVFVYCNPDHELRVVERSNRVLKNSNILKLNLTIGPMALSGSTRMQATTVQQLVVGLIVLEQFKNYDDFNSKFEYFIRTLIDLDYCFLENFINSEANLYLADGLTNYVVDCKYAIAVLTDTTERSPTFSLNGFEAKNETNLCLTYLSVNGEKTTQSAWKKILGREPRCLNWSDSYCLKRLYEFDVSLESISRRQSHGTLELFKISDGDNNIQWSFNKDNYFIKKSPYLLLNHLKLKVLINAHSTLVMGQLGRYSANIMTYVKPSNLKLIDRSYRYISELLGHSGKVISDDVFYQNILEFYDRESKPFVLEAVEKTLNR